MSLRRFYHRYVRHHHRFNIAMILTLVAIGWVVVPAIVSLIDALAHYNPSGYEPKDIERSHWIGKREFISVEDLTLADLLKLALFVFVGLAWLLVAPSIQRPSRSGRR